MNRTGLLFVAAFAMAALFVPTGAVTFDPTGTDTVSGDIELRPAEGPNGDYAVLDENDELELLLTGANPSVDGGGVPADAVTPLPNVFTIRNTDSDAATVWINDDADDVRFYRGDDPGSSIEGRDNSFVLDGSSTVSVGLRIDTRGSSDVAGVDTFTVTAEPIDDGSDDGENVGGGDDGGNVGGGDEESGDSDGGGDTATPSPTPDSGATPAGTDTGQSPPSPAEGGPSATETAIEQPQTDAPTESGDGPIEIGGIGLGPLLAIGGVLVSLLAALASYRQFA